MLITKIQRLLRMENSPDMGTLNAAKARSSEQNWGRQIEGEVAADKSTEIAELYSSVKKCVFEYTTIMNSKRVGSENLLDEISNRKLELLKDIQVIFSNATDREKTYIRENNPGVNLDKVIH